MTAVILSTSASANLVNGTGDVTPDVIFGDGNDNGSFTGVNQNDVELGLRGKLRYNTAGSPENTFNYVGDSTYIFMPSEGNAPANRSVFSFEWSINVDPIDAVIDAFDDLNDLTYLLQIDFDPTDDVDFVEFDPINTLFADHAIGTNGTGNGDGAVAGDIAGYQSLIANNNVAQNSWNMGFFSPPGFDPQTEGQYTINLMAFRDQQLQASTSIDIIYGSVPVPTPSAVVLMLVGVAGLGFAAKRRSKNSE